MPKTERTTIGTMMGMTRKTRPGRTRTKARSLGRIRTSPRPLPTTRRRCGYRRVGLGSGICGDLCLRAVTVKVDDGESGDVTLVALRAKLFVMEKAEDGTAAGWKERGAGMLKVNVPSSSVELDEQGHAEPGTFDASTFDESDDEGAASTKCVRLIMRQDHTLRVILNTIILPGMSFKVTRGLKSSLVLFTAFDDHGKATQMQVKVRHVLLVPLGECLANVEADE